MIKLENTVKITIHEDNDNPFLHDHFASMGNEYTANTDSLKVIGEIPKDLHGIYIRNGHNQVHEPMGVYHAFDGDGMLHSIHFENGKAEYRNRFVRTTGFLAEEAAGKSLWAGMLEPHLSTRRGWGSTGAMKDNAGTDVICHDGRLIASMSQGSELNRLDPLTLDPLEPDTWNMKIANDGGICSHFKVDQDTGEMMFFNFSERPPYMHYGVVDRNSNLVHYTPVELPGVRWPHDIGITKNYSILHDLPFIFDPELLAKGERQVTFFKDMPARFGIIPRHGTNADIKWFEASPCFILHLSNSYERGDEIIMEGCISTNPRKPAVGRQGHDAIRKMVDQFDKNATRYQMHRWTFNMKTGQTKEEYLDDETTEFPTISNAYLGKEYRYSYNAIFGDKPWWLSGLKKYDLLTNSHQRYEFGEGRNGSEAHVALRPNAKDEDDGYLITIVTDMIENQSECVILDAKDITKGPLARIILPERVPNGAHACWVEGDRIHSERK